MEIYNKFSSILVQCLLFTWLRIINREAEDDSEQDLANCKIRSWRDKEDWKEGEMKQRVLSLFCIRYHLSHLLPRPLLHQHKIKYHILYLFLSTKNKQINIQHYNIRICVVMWIQSFYLVLCGNNVKTLSNNSYESKS